MWDSGLQKFRGHFYHVPNILLRDTKCHARTLLCTNTRIEKSESKFYISPKGNKLACFAKS